MKYTVLMGSPHPQGNTAALLNPFLDECKKLNIDCQVTWLYNQDIKPCLGCQGCQKNWEEFACVQKDGMEEIAQAVRASDLLILATPIYSWYCTAPMKSVLDRLIYGMCKYYGGEKGPALLENKPAASIVTCGYRTEKGCDLWEEGLKRWCKHTNMRYIGMLARRDLGPKQPFMDPEKEESARDFAQALRIKLRLEGVL